MRGPSPELAAAPSRPPKLQALLSSAALAVNFFDFWRDRDAGPLIAALGLNASTGVPACVPGESNDHSPATPGRRCSIAALRFEQPMPTGLEGNPPTPDIVLSLTSGETVGIESKFTEWLARRKNSRAPFKPKYFHDGAEHWRDAGLPAAQTLAADIKAGDEVFRYLDAPQLLKQALGLAANGGPHARLQYLYFDLDNPPGRVHRGELERFAGRIDGSLQFRATSYQHLFERLDAHPAVDRGYLAYLRDRYLG